MKEHTFTRSINSILTDNKFDRFVGNKRSGKLDHPNLAKIGFSEKVFKKLEARKNKDYKVTIVCDASGSMQGSSARHLEQSLEFLMKSLNKTDIKYSIMAFAEVPIIIKDFDSDVEIPKVITAYDKFLWYGMYILCPSCNVIITADYGGSGTHKLKKCPYCKTDLYQMGTGGTNDGMALHIANEEIRKQSGKHIIIMLSDGGSGGGSGYRWLTKDGPLISKFHLKKVVKQVIKDGTVLCSVGIQSDDVKKFYPPANTKVINNSAQIGTAIMGILKKLIKRG